jgi:hypothetical protein
VINLLILTVDPKDMGQATAMNNVFRNVGGSIGSPIAGSLLATYTTSAATPFGPIVVPAHAAFQYAFWIAAVVTLVGSLTVLFGQEVLGPSRHAKFAHHPMLHRRGAATPPPPTPPRPSDATTPR